MRARQSCGSSNRRGDNPTGGMEPGGMWGLCRGSLRGCNPRNPPCHRREGGEHPGQHPPAQLPRGRRAALGQHQQEAHVQGRCLCRGVQGTAGTGVALWWRWGGAGGAGRVPAALVAFLVAAHGARWADPRGWDRRLLGKGGQGGVPKVTTPLCRALLGLPRSPCPAFPSPWLLLPGIVPNSSPVLAISVTGKGGPCHQWGRGAAEGSRER